MQAASATPAFFHVNVGSDSEEEVSPLTRRPRANRGDPVLGARNEHLKTPSQSSRPPQRPAPAVPGERMVGIQDIGLKTQPTAKPAPNRPAPPIPKAGNPVPQAGNTVLKTEAPSLLERQRPAPIATARPQVAEPADTEVWSTPPQSPSELLSPAASPSHASLPSLSLPSTPSSLSSPSSPEAHTPVRPSPDTKGKGKVEESPPATPPTAKASTSAALPVETGPASPTEAVLHPAQAPGVGRLAEAFAVDIEALMRISLFRHGHATPREDLYFMHRLLQQTQPFLDRKAELFEAQAALKDVLEQHGDLSGISRPRLRELETLARADIRGQLADVSQLKKDLADARQDIINEGGDPKWISQPPRPIREIEAERARRIAEDNEALRLGHYTF